MWVGLAFLLVVLVAIVSYKLGQMSVRQPSTGSIGSRGQLLSVTYNANTYANPDEMPDAERGAYNFALDNFVDRNRDGKIDALEPMNLPPVPLDRRDQARQTFQQLKQLEQLKKDGMITTAEYSAKRTELLRTTES